MFSVQGIGEVVVTAMCTSELTTGALVRYWINHEVTEAVNGQTFHGIALQNRKGLATSVQIGGFVTVPYTGDAPSLGYERLVSNGDGVVKIDTAENTNNPLRLVVEVDTSEQLVTFMM